MRIFYSLPALKKCVGKNTPNAAFYYFPNITCHLNTQVNEVDKEGKEVTTTIQTDTDLSLYLIREAKVVTIPGSSFLRAGHLRLAYARYGPSVNARCRHANKCIFHNRDRKTIQEGLTAMAKALDKLQPRSG